MLKINQLYEVKKDFYFGMRPNPDFNYSDTDINVKNGDLFIVLETKMKYNDSNQPHSYWFKLLYKNVVSWIYWYNFNQDDSDNLKKSLEDRLQEIEE